MFIPGPGERLFISGKTGWGKTSGGIFVLQHIEAAPAIIYDTKGEPKFLALKNSVLVTTPWEIDQAVEAGEHDYIVVQPPLEILDNPAALDESYLLHHYHHFQGLPAFIDEGRTFQRNGRAGPGLIALLTRGRSKGITTILGAQRPRFIDGSCVTEMDKAMLYRLQDLKDRKRMDDLISDFSDLAQPRKFEFYAWDAARDDEDGAPVLMAPVPLDGIPDPGYVDKEASPVPIGGSGPQPDAPKSPKAPDHIWL